MRKRPHGCHRHGNEAMVWSMDLNSPVYMNFFLGYGLTLGIITKCQSNQDAEAEVDK